MIRSMTGFGKATGNSGSNMISVEVKSLNSKFLELSLRLPAVYKDKELELRNDLSKQIERGKVDFSVTIEPTNGSKKSFFNRELVKQYFADLKDIQKDLGFSEADYLDVIMRLPNVLNNDKTEADEKEWKLIEQLCSKAVKEFIQFRTKEGKALETDFLSRLVEIEKCLKKIEKAEPGRLKNIKNRLIKGLEHIEDNNVDKNRFEQELIYYIEKIDITEEKVRLRSHLKFFGDTLKEKDSNGKKLGFILQEIGREINTIGAKANDAEIQRNVVMMKDELEKMKEQSANVV